MAFPVLDEFLIVSFSRKVCSKYKVLALTSLKEISGTSKEMKRMKKIIELKKLSEKNALSKKSESL